MKLQQIKQAVQDGKNVHWKNARYTVVFDGIRYLIKDFTGSCIGLTWADGLTLNGKEEDFYLGDD